MSQSVELFISYRRSDAQGHARALHNALCRQFDPAHVFFDLETIEAGDYFPELLNNGVTQCSVLLALIAGDWLECVDENGRQRLQDSRDYVRQEVARALSLEKRVIPILFDKTEMPATERLPDDLKRLAGCNALQIRGKTYEYNNHIAELVRILAMVPGVSAPKALRGDVVRAGSGRGAAWADAPDTNIFHGRTEELTKLEQWVLTEGCRLVAILGSGGVGKTSLAARFGALFESRFECRVWLTLKTGAVPLQDLLALAITSLSDREDVGLPRDLGDRLSSLMVRLRQRKCLLVLDNVETILRERTSGAYLEEYEGYSDLFRRIGEGQHNSCLILTSREQPSGLEAGDRLPVRLLALAGVTTATGQEIFERVGSFTATKAQWQLVVDHYAGNPLALKIVADAAREVFGGDLSKLIERFHSGELAFEKMSDLLERQFKRLSPLEASITYWLAIHREAVSVDRLAQEIFPPEQRRDVLSAVYTLIRRSLIERKADCFTLQPVIMEYTVDLIVGQITKAIATGELALLCSHPLFLAEAKGFIRDVQQRLMLGRVKDHLLDRFETKNKAIEHLSAVLSTLRHQSAFHRGYAAGTILNLLVELKASLDGMCLSDLEMRQAFLVAADLRGADFSRCDLAHSVFRDTFGSVLSAAFSRDGTLFATGDTLCDVRVWQALDIKPLVTCKGHLDWVRCVEFSPDGTTLASCSADRSVKLWDAHTGECVRTFRGHSGRVWSLTFSSDGERIASGSQDTTVKLWNVRTGECVMTLEGHAGWVQSVAFSRSEKYVASGSADRTIRIWDITSGEPLKVLKGHDDWVQSVAFSPDDATLASGSNDKTARIWDVETGKCLHELHGHSNWLQSVAFSPLGEVLMTGGEDGTIRIWNTNTGRNVRTLYSHSNRVRSVASSPDGGMFISGSDDQTVGIWDSETGQCLRRLKGYLNRPWSIAYSSDGRLLAGGYEDSAIRIWDVATGRSVNVLRKHDNWIRSVAFASDHETLASGSDDHTVMLWHVRNGWLRTCSQHKDKVRGIVFAPDARTLASASDDHTVKLWDVATGLCVHTLRAHSDKVRSVAFCADGRFLVSGSNDRTAILWDWRTGQPVRIFRGHGEHVRSVACSPDGETIATCSADHTVRIWRTDSDHCIRVLQGHQNWVRSVAFSPDGHFVASGSADETIKLWHTTNGTRLKTFRVPPIHGINTTDADFRGYTDLILSVAFSPDRTTLASSSADQLVRVWDLHAGDCLAVYRAERPYEGMNITEARGLTQGQRDTLKALGAVEDKSASRAVSP